MRPPRLASDPAVHKTSRRYLKYLMSSAFLLASHQAFVHWAEAMAVCSSVLPVQHQCEGFPRTDLPDR